jgi:hypothetical protein
MSEKPISPLRRRMIEDIAPAESGRRGKLRQSESWIVLSGTRLAASSSLS